MRVAKIDVNGLFVEDVIIKDETELTADMVITPCPEGFHWPKWDGEKWVEGGTAAIPTPDQQIANLKAQLNATDYKVIKCSECSLAGAELPYDIATLHIDRQAIRDQINTIESAQ